jgi:TPR repeat protein
MKTGISSFFMLVILAAPMAHGDAIADLTTKAEAGEIAAQVELANIFAKGQGVAKDEKEAAKWYLKAAEQGNPEAQLFLGTAYLRGRVFRGMAGRPAKWYLLAAEQGNAVGAMPDRPDAHDRRGVPKDDVQAFKWANLASAQGDSAAKNLRAVLTMRMTLAQIQQAEELSRQHLETPKSELPGEEVTPTSWSPLSRRIGTGDGLKSTRPVIRRHIC